ncbi:host specificity protein, partial [Pseudomonas kitaguniensis]
QIIETKIEELDGKVVSTASSVEALRSAARGDDGAGDLADAVKGWTSTADLAVERKTRASEIEAAAQQLLTLAAQVGDNRSSLTVLEQVVATNRETAATQVTQLKSDLKTTADKVGEQGGTIAGQGRAIEGQAGAISELGTRVSTLDGKITSQASSNESLRASVRGDDGAGELAGAIKA